MRHHRNSVFSDDELLGMLIREPQLLALADALVVSRAGEIFEAVPRTPRRSARPPLGAVAAGLAAAVSLALLLLSSLWTSGPTPIEEALAAVGSAPVLHVVIAYGELAGAALIDLETGKPIERTATTEIWFDRSRDLKRTVLTLDGRLVEEQLETAAGGFTAAGRIFTCAWIRTHPAEAAREGVSCPDPAAAGDGRPALDAALAEFVDGYRTALASGKAKAAGEGRIDGRDVLWLQFRTSSSLQRVAVDASTHRPVKVETGDRATSFRVLTAETVGYQPSLFRQPQPARSQRGGSSVSEREIELRPARELLGGGGLWLGREWDGLELASVVEQERRVSFAGETDPERASIVKLTYVRSGEARPRSRIEIYQARRCLVSLGWSCGPRDPSDANTVGYPLGRLGPALLSRDGLFVSVWGAADLQARSLELVRALVPLPEGS